MTPDPVDDIRIKKKCIENPIQPVCSVSAAQPDSRPEATGSISFKDKASL